MTVLAIYRDRPRWVPPSPSDIVTRIVPCGSCRACCINDAIFLHPESGDVVAAYDSEMATHPIRGDRRPMLKHKPNGECVYLAADGCSIHARRPVICREYDCADAYAKIPRAERRRLLKAGMLNTSVIEAGRRQWLARPKQ